MISTAASRSWRPRRRPPPRAASRCAASHPNVRPPVDTSSPGTLPSSTVRSSSRPTTSTGGSPGRTHPLDAPERRVRVLRHEPALRRRPPARPRPGPTATRSPDGDSSDRVAGRAEQRDHAAHGADDVVSTTWSRTGSASPVPPELLAGERVGRDDDEVPVVDDRGRGQPGQDRERGHRGRRVVGQHVPVGEVEDDDVRLGARVGARGRARGGAVGHQADDPVGLGARLGVRRAAVVAFGYSGSVCAGSGPRSGVDQSCVAGAARRARRRTRRRPARRARRAGRRARPARPRAQPCPGRTASSTSTLSPTGSTAPGSAATRASAARSRRVRPQLHPGGQHGRGDRDGEQPPALPRPVRARLRHGSASSSSTSSTVVSVSRRGMAGQYRRRAWQGGRMAPDLTLPEPASPTPATLPRCAGASSPRATSPGGGRRRCASTPASGSSRSGRGRPNARRRSPPRCRPGAHLLPGARRRPRRRRRVRGEPAQPPPRPRAAGARRGQARPRREGVHAQRGRGPRARRRGPRRGRAAHGGHVDALPPAHRRRASRARGRADRRRAPGHRRLRGACRPATRRTGCSTPRSPAGRSWTSASTRWRSPRLAASGSRPDERPGRRSAPSTGVDAQVSADRVRPAQAPVFTSMLAVPRTPRRSTARRSGRGGRPCYVPAR